MPDRIIRDAINNAPNVGTGPGLTPIQSLRERRNSIKNAIDRTLDIAQMEKRELLRTESVDFDLGVAEVRAFDARIAELEERAADEAVAVAARKMFIPDGVQRTGPADFYTSSETYHPGAGSPSYFKDLIYSQRGDANAADRLRRNNQEQGMESRALGNTGGTGGSGAEFAPPAYLVQDFIKLARPGRVTADLFHHEDLPAGVSSVNLPRVLTGTTTAVQSTQNTTLAQTDATTAMLTSGITTIGGKQVVSQQLMDQSAIPFDRVILEDLAADYAKQLGTMVLTGTGTGGQLKGYLTPASTNVVTWSPTTPSAAGFYSQLARLQGQINATRYATPDTVVMHPRRWAWFASFTDSTGRPLVVPTAGGFNSLAAPGAAAAAGHVGSVLGMDVFTDPNIPTTIGTAPGNTQDIVLVFVRDDVWLWESSLRAEAFVQPYSDSLAVLLRVYAYSALVPDRYLASLGQITGTGLVTPVFAS